MSNKNFYNKDSIQSLSPLEFTRLRPGVYCGSTEYSTQLLIEISANVIDEFRVGHGNKMIVNISDDNVISVEDNAQGFPINEMKEDGTSVLESAFSTLNTSGKYTDDGVYEGIALGLNGIGSKIANYLSHWLEVTSWNNGKYEHVWFEEGQFLKREIGKWDNKEKVSGTLVKWKPSEEFFTHPEVELSVIKKLFKAFSCLCPGFTIQLNDKTFYSKNGLFDLIDENIKKSDEIINNRLNFSYNQDKYKLDFALTYTNNYSTIIVPYVNTGLTDNGPHITQVKAILTREINKFFREKNWLKEKDANLTGDDIQEGLCLVFNITTPGVSYDAQTKSRIVKLDMKPFTETIISEIQNWLNNNEKEIKQIADKALAARKAREAAAKAREAIRNKSKKKTVLDMPSTLADCHATDRTKCELYITEGRSASGGAKTIRDAKYQAVMGLRGKILNALTADLDKIHKNVEIMNIIKALGMTWSSDGKTVIWNEDALRYRKVIIASDRDSDGNHIQLLVLTCLWQLVPELILKGYVYIALPPLFKAKWGTKYEYLQDKKALEDFRAKHSGEFSLNYFKGYEVVWPLSILPKAAGVYV